MPRACTVCRNEERSRIDYLLASGVRPQAVADRFGINHFAVRRHNKNHITDAFRASVKAGPFKSEDDLRRICNEQGVSVLESLRALLGGYQSLWTANIEAGATSGATQVGREMHAVLLSIAKITQELQPPGPSSVTVNLVSSEWFQAHTRWLTELIRRHPQIRDDVIGHLRSASQSLPGSPEPVIEGKALEMVG